MSTGLLIFGFTNPGTFEDNSVLARYHVQCSKLKANLFSEQNKPFWLFFGGEGGGLFGGFWWLYCGCGLFGFF